LRSSAKEVLNEVKDSGPKEGEEDIKSSYGRGSRKAYTNSIAGSSAFAHSERQPEYADRRGGAYGQ